MNPLVPPLRRFLEGQLGASILADRLEAERHVRFLTPLLSLGALGFALFPLWLVAGSFGGVHAAIAFAWLIAPLAIAAFVMRTGRIDLGRKASAIGLAGFVTWLCAISAWAASPALMLFAGIPLAERNDDRSAFAAVVAGSGIALVAAIGLLVGDGASSAGHMAAMVGVAALATFATAFGFRHRVDVTDTTEPSRQPTAAGEPLSGMLDMGGSEATLEAVATLAGMLARTADGTAPGEVEPLARLIKLSAEGLRNDQGEMLPVTTVGDPRPVPLPLAGVMRTALDLLSPLARSHDVAIMPIAEETPLTETEADSVRRVTLLLAAFGIKSGCAGAITLEGTRRPEAIRLVLRMAPNAARQPFVQHVSRYSHPGLAEADLTELTVAADALGASVALVEEEGLAPAIAVDWPAREVRRLMSLPNETEVRRSA